jgi:hypothetical protein
MSDTLSDKRCPGGHDPTTFEQMERDALLGVAVGQALDECESCCLDNQADRDRVLLAVVKSIKPFVKEAL